MLPENCSLKWSWNRNICILDTKLWKPLLWATQQTSTDIKQERIPWDVVSSFWKLVLSDRGITMWLLIRLIVHSFSTQWIESDSSEKNEPCSPGKQMFVHLKLSGAEFGDVTRDQQVLTSSIACEIANHDILNAIHPSNTGREHKRLNTRRTDLFVTHKQKRRVLAAN